MPATHIALPTTHVTPPWVRGAAVWSVPAALSRAGGSCAVVRRDAHGLWSGGMDLHRNVARALAAARELGLDLEVRDVPEGARTAQQAADAVGAPVGAIVKSLVLASDAGPLMVMTSGANRVSYGKVEAATGRSGVGRCDAEAARAATSYPVGGVSPFGHPAPLPMLIDRDLLAYDEVWAAAGTPHAVFPMAPDDLVHATGAEPADIAEQGLTPPSPTPRA